MTSRLIALVRLALLIPLIWLLTDGGALHYWGALVVFLFVSLAGLADEYLLHPGVKPSPFVGALQVMADRLLVVVVVAGLIAAGMREGLVLLASLILIARNVVIAALNEAMPGEANTIPMAGLEKGRLGLQLIGFGFLIPPNFPLPETVLPSHVLGGVALILAAILSIITLTGYTRRAVAGFKAAT